MSWIIHTLLVGIVISLAVLQASSSGVFELRLLSFDNVAGRDDMGKCCTGLAGPNSECEGMCRPRFRVCLKEYQVKIDTTSPCTFGDVITNELEPNTGMDKPHSGFVNSIAFPFPFTWTGTFSLIVEAWHGNQSSSHSAVLVSRLARQKWLGVSDNWTEDVHTTKYSTLRFEYRVTCTNHYYGKGCENLCRARDDSFGHYSCSPTGERVCLAGWTGDYCSTPRCLAGCDEQHGHCTKPNECRCQSGWEGPLCNQCQRYPGCMYGTCVKPWDCLCNEGWGGLFCNQDLNFCTNHKPCRNGGTCFNTGQGSYTCRCQAGYTGTNCELALHNCLKTPCVNGGICSRNGTLNVCVCPPGYDGPRCESPASKSTITCNEPPCKNNNSSGVTCTDVESLYKCECRPCANGGTCLQLTNDFRCKCPPGFTGKDCSEEIRLDYCQFQPCRHGGSCVNRVNGYECICPSGFLGSECEEISSSAAPSARVSSESNLTTEHIVVIATISTFVPLVVLVAVGVIIGLKQRRKREKARADEEARLQNEQNTANSSFAKRGAAAVVMSPDAHMIKNSWGGGKCTNNVISSTISSPDDCSVSNISVIECDGYPKWIHHQVIDGRPVYSITD